MENDVSEHSAEMRDSSGAIEGNEAASAEEAVAFDQQQSADILKLDIDCFEEIIDYLSLKDLISIGRTCKQLNQMAGYVFRQNYSATKAVIAGGINQPKTRIAGQLVDDRFNHSIHKIDIRFNDGLQQFDRIPSTTFRRLKRVNLLWVDLSQDVLECSKEKFNRIEHLGLYNCKLQGNFHESVLAFCSNLKRLHVIGQTYGNSPILIGNGNDWLHRKYSKLEHLLIDVLNGEFNVDELIPFLELNPNIQKLSLPEQFATWPEHLLMNAKVALDELAIKIWGHSMDATFFRRLKSLHDRGFYKRLKVYVCSSELDQQVIDQFASLNTVVKLSGSFDNRIELSHLRGIEELSIKTDDKIIDYSHLLSNFINLERIEFEWASSDDLLPLIRQVVQLNKIKVIDLEDGIHFNEFSKIIDLNALNRERETLARAKKITIYLKEDIYLATKRALTETNFNLIQLERIESFEWDNDFATFTTI